MSIRKFSFWLLLFLVAIQSPVFAFDHSYKGYDRLLQDIVVEKGLQTAVDYKRLHNDAARLNEFTQRIESVSRSEYDSWSADQQLAFLINAYNALTLQLIIMHYPGIESIKDTGGFFSSPWKKEFFTLLGEQSSLDHIEHDLIRKQFSEPRIHFAVNCASRGCPPLQPFAYVAEKLDQQLDYATRRFLQDPERNRYIADEQRLELSSIFKWYGEDFVKAAGSIANFAAPYMSDDPAMQKAITGQNIRIDFLDYDWSLNDIEGH